MGGLFVLFTVCKVVWATVRPIVGPADGWGVAGKGREGAMERTREGGFVMTRRRERREVRLAWEDEGGA